jgi:type VI secretion system secreted protein Hcp
MSTNFLLKVDGGGIKGESPVDGYTDYMQLTSLNFGGTQTGSFGTGIMGGGAGKFTADDFEVRMWTNKASPKFLEACANGTHLKTATLVALKAGGGKAVEYLKVTLSDVIVSRFKTEYKPPRDEKLEEHEHTVDTVGLNFSKISVEYKEQKPDGSAGPSVTGGWDLAKLKAGK